MLTDSMKSLFRTLPSSTVPHVTIQFDGAPHSVPAGISVAAALLVSGVQRFRATPMGVCFECLVEIDGLPNQQSCLANVREGMQIRSQEGARVLCAAAQCGSSAHGA